MFPIAPAPNARKYFLKRLASLVQFDEVRLMQIFESIQYCLGYLVVGFLFGTILDSVFPKFEEEKETTSIFLEVILQTIALIILIFYTRKVVKLMPFLFTVNFDVNGDGVIQKYRPYESTEYSGEITIAIILIGSQINFIRKIDVLSRRFQSYVLGVESSITKFI
jgi:hypothetical protein